MTPDKTPSDSDLQERCAEIVEWQRTGVLPGNALRNYAAKHWAGHTDALQMAERDTSALAMEQIAKWGSPVVAGDVDRADAVNLARNALTQYDCAITKKGVRVLAEAVLSMDSALTTPQPTQAQAGAVPLTDAQADSIAMAAFEKHCGRPHPWEGAQPWVIAAIKAAARLKEMAP